MAAMNFDFEALPPAYCTRCSSVQKKSKTTKQRVELNDTMKDSLYTRYSPAVLVGNWVDRRADYKPPPDNWITVYDSTYTCKTNLSLPKDRQACYDNKINVERGLGSEFLIKHRGDHFNNNYTTTNDLLFRIFPTGLCGPKKRKYSSRLNLWLPEADLTKNFGNLTNLFPPEEHITEECGCPKQVTEQKRFPKPKGNWDVPLLCHLDIDPELPFRPHLVKTSGSPMVMETEKCGCPKENSKLHDTEKLDSCPEATKTEKCGCPKEDSKLKDTVKLDSCPAKSCKTEEHGCPKGINSQTRIHNNYSMASKPNIPLTHKAKANILDARTKEECGCPVIN